VPEHEAMQEPLADPQFASRMRMPALQAAQSGGLRISAAFSAEAETGTG
jgi:hypothetical protein